MDSSLSNRIDPKILGIYRYGELQCFPTPTKVESHLGTDENGTEAKRDWTNKYASIIGTMLYLESNTIPNIHFSVYNFNWFNQTTKASQQTAVKMICWYIQGTKEKGLVFNPYKKMVLIFLLMQILRDCGETITLKKTIVLILGLGL